MELKPGTYLQGDKYRIISTLGQGGFGITYLAEHEMAGRKVCIKEFFPKEYYNRDEDSRSISLGSKGSAQIMDAYKQKFVKEVKTIARLDHPNIIHIYDVFAENNTAYYVMEYIEGASLSSIVKSRGALSEAEALMYVRAIANALGYIHERKIMHLDIKPANIMLRSDDERAILIDFGLSKQYDADGNQTSSTPVGISAGFAPMEQYQQGGVKEFSPETDIYSLGATLYYLVTGKVPPQAAVIVDEGLPELPSHLSAGLRKAIDASMTVQRKRRPHSVKEFLDLMQCDSQPVVDAEPIVEENEATQIDVKADDSTALDISASASNKSMPKPEVKPEPKQTPAPQPKVEVKPEPKPAEPKKKKGKWWLWLLLLLVVAGGAAAWFMSGPKDEPTPTPEPITIVADTIEAVDSVEVVAPIVEPEQPVVEPAPTPAPIPEPTPTPDPVLRLTSDSRVTVEHGGDNGTIRYTLENPASGVNLSVSDDASWLTTSRSGNTISYSASANESQSSRTATITVRYGDQSFEVVITQNGKPVPAPSPTQSRSNYTESGGGYGNSMKMVWVEGGTFLMGSTNGESDEQSVHPVTLSGYWIAETEVTQAQWEAVMGTTVRQQRDLADPSWPLRGEGPNNPMYCVNYDEAKEFCRRLSAATGKTYTLPTEAQWEYAARGGNRANGTIFTYSGSNTIRNVAWYSDNSGSQTHPVKQKDANQLGLYDMSGNVWEWCLDWYSSSYYSSSPQNNPQGPSSGQYRVVRGGSYFGNASCSRVTDRSYETPSRRWNFGGFRVVCLP